MIESLISLLKEYISDAGAYEWIKYALIGLLIISVFIDVSKIKLDPWKWILRRIAKIFNSEVLKAVDAISQRMDSVELMQQIHQMHNLRRNILRFADLLRSGDFNFSKELFDNVCREIDEYEKLCKTKIGRAHV